MTTNQTIEGGLRELLERILSYAWFPSWDVTAFDLRLIDREQLRALLDAPPVTLDTKYDDTLIPFVALMRKELHANTGKGDRPGWLTMSSYTCLLEIIYHFGKLQASVKRGDGDGMAEYGAGVANLCMMLLDICGVINLIGLAEQPAPVLVVMPERRDSDLRSPVYGYARGWNACLDELKHLNDL